MRRALLLSLGAVGIVALGAAALFLRPGHTSFSASAVDAAPPVSSSLGEASVVVFDGKFENGWQYWGFGAHELPANGPARISFESFGGLVVQSDRPQARPFGALLFRFKAPPGFNQFLKVSLGTTRASEAKLPEVALMDEHLSRLNDGWVQASVPFLQLNPQAHPFERISISARRMVSSEWVEIDKIALTKPAQDSAASVEVVVACREPAREISPLIYGILVADDPLLGATAERIGGNPMTRLNWDAGNVWNTGSDWFFENVQGDSSVWDWFEKARKKPTKLAMLVPTIGWVAKDSTSVGFPVSKLGPQRKTDPHRPDAGDGAKPDGSLLATLPPTQTSVAAPPQVIRRWLEKLRKLDQERGRSIYMHILDNEPSLWNVTHRDVHPEPVSYDELLQNTLSYGAVIREVDPEAVIAGPADWGWSAYFDSAKDLASGGFPKTDRLRHGGSPLLPWYLKKLAENERATGKRILDVVDVHFYPQAEGVYAGAKTDPQTAALRIRSTRALWDPTYQDESWINDRVQLIPRVQGWINENYPGRGLSLGEWSFGAEDHISGGLALAEALGRFGQQGLTAAFLWAKLKPGTPGYLAFNAFRNFDGKNAAFEAWSVPTRSAGAVSAFVSRDVSSRRFVAILLNLDSAVPARVSLELADCGKSSSRRVFGFGPASTSMEDYGERRPSRAEARIDELVPPYSLRVIDFRVD